jgi:hypothetical protein
VSIASPLMQPSPNGRRVGIRIVTFEACSGFTHVTAHRVAQPPKAAFVTRLQPFRSPGRAARQLPDQSTTLWVDSSSTGDSRLRGALPKPDLETRPRWAWSAASAVWLGWGKIKATIAHESHPFCAESHYFCGESHELWESHFLLCFANGDTHLRGQVSCRQNSGRNVEYGLQLHIRDDQILVSSGSQALRAWRAAGSSRSAAARVPARARRSRCCSGISPAGDRG